VDPGLEVEGQYDWLTGPSFAEPSPSPAEAPTHRILAVNGEPFDSDRAYAVALPRNLLKGFCNIAPLVEWHARVKATVEVAAATAKDKRKLEEGWVAFDKSAEPSPSEPSPSEPSSSEASAQGQQVPKPAAVAGEVNAVGGNSGGVGLPSEDAFIPLVNLCVAHFSRAHWRDIAAQASFHELDSDGEAFTMPSVQACRSILLP